MRLLLSHRLVVLCIRVHDISSLACKYEGGIFAIALRHCGSSLPRLAPIPAPAAKALACTGSALPACEPPRPDPAVQPMFARSLEPMLVSSIAFSGAETTGLGISMTVFFFFAGGSCGWSGWLRASLRSNARSL